MGDDLIAARAFVDLCDESVAALIDGKLDGDDAIRALDQIDEKASQMQARAIGRVTRLVSDDFRFERPAAQRGGNLLALNKLVSQYKSGLEQVENELMTRVEPLSVPDERAAFEIAAATLRSVMDLARPGAERNALQALTNFKVPKTDTSKQNLLPLEGEMPLITDEILRTARQQDKTVSVSLSAGAIALSQEYLKVVVRAMAEIGNHLVSNSIETPEIRRQKGRSRSAHISFTAQVEGDVFHVLVTTTGKSPSKMLFASHAVVQLVGMGMKTGLSNEKQSVSIALADLPLRVAGSGKVRPDLTETIDQRKETA